MLQTFDERNRDLQININGKLLHREEAGISPFDSVVQGGDAVWEGLRLYNGRIFRLDEHLDRLRHSAVALGFAEIPSHEAIVEEIRKTGLLLCFNLLKFCAEATNFLPLQFLNRFTLSHYYLVLQMHHPKSFFHAERIDVQ